MQVFRNARVSLPDVTVPELLYHHRLQAYQEETSIVYNAQGEVTFDTDRHNHLDLRTIGPCNITLQGTPRTATATNPLIISLQRLTRSIYQHAFATPVQWVTGYEPRWASGYGEVDKLLVWWEPGPARWFGATFYPGPVAYYPLLTAMPGDAAALFILTNLTGSTQDRVYDALGSGTYLELFGGAGEGYRFTPQGLELSRAEGGYARSSALTLNLTNRASLHGVFASPETLSADAPIMSMGHPDGRALTLRTVGVNALRSTWQPQGKPEAQTPALSIDGSLAFSHLELTKDGDALTAGDLTRLALKQPNHRASLNGAVGDGAKFAATGNRVSLGTTAAGPAACDLTCSLLIALPRTLLDADVRALYEAFRVQLAGAANAGGNLPGAV